MSIQDYMTDHQLIAITGPRGVGKTLLAATYAPPSIVDKVYWHDSERSANRTLKNLEDAGLHFGNYVSLGARFHDLPDDDDLLEMLSEGKLPWVDKKKRSALADYYEYIMQDLAENLEQDKYDVYVHDTLEKLEAGMAAWVEANKRDAGVTTTAFGKLWTEGVYPLYENFIEAIFSRGVKTIILTSHLKTPWEGNRPVVGKVKPSGKKILYRLSALMIWMVNDKRNADGAPAGLVLKERMGKLVPDKETDEWVIKRMLPERIPHCTWSDIGRYMEEGIDFGNLSDLEIMSPDEKEMISELLSDEQMRLMILAEEKELAEIQSQGTVLSQGTATFNVSELSSAKSDDSDNEDDTDDSPEALAKMMLMGGSDPGEVAKAFDLPLPLILKMKKEL